MLWPAATPLAIRIDTTRSRLPNQIYAHLIDRDRRCERLCLRFRARRHTPLPVRQVLLCDGRAPQMPRSMARTVSSMPFQKSSAKAQKYPAAKKTAVELSRWSDFSPFEEALKNPGPWIAGINFPFGQSRTFIENIGWPGDWAGYVEHARSLGREGFRKALDAYRGRRPFGDKEHRRATDVAASSVSPPKDSRRAGRVNVL
jgi:hypothetical protein